MAWTPMVVDLSHHNTIPKSLDAAYALGIRGVIHKATEGYRFTDKKYNARRALAKDAGMLWGAYHFFRPGNVAAQVDFFLKTAQPDENTLLALDHEDASVNVDAVKLFLTLIKIKTNRMPVLYTGHVLREQLGGVTDQELGRYRLWHAQYGQRFTVNESWKAPWLWQFTETGKVPGIEGKVDVNKYDGPPEQLAKEWSGSLLNAEVA
jgi:lysozyme